MAQRRERADHERRAHDEHERERHLYDDQSAARPAPLVGRTRAARGARHARIDVERMLERRNRAEQERRRERDGHGEREHGRMDSDLANARQVARSQGDEDLKSRVCEPEAERATRRAQDEALDEQLSRDALRSCAERGAHGELLAPRVRPHEHEIRDVGARDEQHGADRTHEHPQGARDTADQVVLQRPHDGAHSPAREVFAPQPELGGRQWPRVAPDRQRALQVGLSLRYRDTGLEPRESFIAEVADDDLLGLELYGEDHVGLRRHVEESEVGRHDADHVRRPRQGQSAAAALCRDRQLAPERRVVAAESPLPERVRENDGQRTLGRGPVFLLRESTSARRLHAERLKRAVRHQESAYPLRLAAIGQRRRAL